MSLINLNANTNTTSFNIRTPVLVNPNNRAPALYSGHIVKYDQGPVGVPILASAIIGHTIVLSPQTANQVYTLPTAAAIINEYGVSVDTGVAKLSLGSMIRIDIINRGAFPALVAANPTGGDGTAVFCYTGSIQSGGAAPGFSGNAPLGKITPIYLELLNVGSGYNGVTGTYTVYH